jgi:hypothetical protein
MLKFMIQRTVNHHEVGNFRVFFCSYFLNILIRFRFFAAYFLLMCHIPVSDICLCPSVCVCGKKSKIGSVYSVKISGILFVRNLCPFVAGTTLQSSSFSTIILSDAELYVSQNLKPIFL